MPGYDDIVSIAGLKSAQIEIKGLFLNADAGFDSEGFRKICFIEDIHPNIDFNKRNIKNTDHQPLLIDELYEERFVVERTNAWIDAFKILLVRFDTSISSWLSQHYLAFSLILLRRCSSTF